jgi:ribonuclease J
LLVLVINKLKAFYERCFYLAEKNSKYKLKVIFLGGLGEIGKNMMLLEYGNDIIIVDCGLAFPENDMFGVDLVIPDFTYVIENKRKIRGLILTHGHEDHIGAVSYLLRYLNIPIYGSKLTLGLLEGKLRESGTFKKSSNFCVQAGESIKLGVFNVEFIHTTHSIAGSVALAINTPVGVVVHSGDFKIDYTPIEEPAINLQRFAEIGKKGVLLFLCESTNIE